MLRKPTIRSVTCPEDMNLVGGESTDPEARLGLPTRLSSGTETQRRTSLAGELAGQVVFDRRQHVQPRDGWLQVCFEASRWRTSRDKRKDQFIVADKLGRGTSLAWQCGRTTTTLCRGVQGRTATPVRSGQRSSSAVEWKTSSTFPSIAYLFVL